MHQFRFSLERVLRLKAQGERLAEIKEMQARAVCVQAQERVAELNRQLTRLTEEIESRRGKLETMSAWASQLDQAARLCKAMQAAQHSLASAEKALNEAATARAKAAREVESLRILRMQQWQQYREQLAREGQIHLDEQAMRQWRPTQPGEDQE